MGNQPPENQPLAKKQAKQQVDQHRHKRKRKYKKKKEHQKEQRTIVIHLNQLGSTTVVDTVKLRNGQLGQILESLAIEESTRSQSRWEQLDNIKKEKIEFLSNCRNLIQTIILGPVEVDNDKPLEKLYQVFESVVSTLQAHLQLTKED